MFAGNARHKFPVANFPLVKWDAGRERGTVAVRQIVQHNHFFSFGKEPFNRDTANVPRSARNQDGHMPFLVRRFAPKIRINCQL